MKWVMMLLEIRALEVGAKYNYLENAKVYGEYQYWKATPNSDKVTMNGFILGTDYWFTKQVVTYLEAGTFKYKNKMINQTEITKSALVSFISNLIYLVVKTVS